MEPKQQTEPQANLADEALTRELKHLEHRDVVQTPEYGTEKYWQQRLHRERLADEFFSKE